MITESLIALAVYILNAVLPIINAFLDPITQLGAIPYNGVVGASYIFGNLGLFNQIFPVTELIFLVTITLGIKTAVFGFKIFWAVTELSSKFFKKFISFRF